MKYGKRCLHNEESTTVDSPVNMVTLASPDAGIVEFEQL